MRQQNVSEYAEGETREFDEALEARIRRFARRYEVRGIAEREDLLQAGRLGALEGLECHDATQGASRLTWATRWAQGAIANYVRYQRQIRGWPAGKQAKGMGGIRESTIADMSTHSGDGMATRVCMRLAIDAWIADLPQTEAGLCRAIRSGEAGSVYEALGGTSASRNSSGYRLAKLRRRYRAYMEATG